MAMRSQHHGLSQVGGYQDSPVVSGPFGGHATLANGLVSAWKLDEESGTRNDSHGTNHLTDNNTVGFAAGLNGNAASFVAANTERLTNAAALIDWTGSWTVAGWFKLTDTSGFRGVFGNHPVGGSSFMLYTNAGGAQYTADFQGTLLNRTGTANAWAFLVAWHDNTDDSIGFSLDDSAATGTKNITTDGSQFVVGATTLAGANPFHGPGDAVLLYSRALIAQERTDLYAAGAGLFY